LGAIQVRNLTKYFGYKVAVGDISCGGWVPRDKMAWKVKREKV
jgi:hypothetical protein